MRKTEIKYFCKIFVFLVVLNIPIVYYLYNSFIVDKNYKNSTKTLVEEDSAEKDLTKDSDIVREVSGSTSAEAIKQTLNAGREWSNDVELFSCSGVPLDGNSRDSSELKPSMYTWSCMYYSSNLAKTRVYKYSRNEVVAQDPGDVLDCVKYIYQQVDYPDNYELILDSGEIYQKALENGLNMHSLVNFHLRNIPNYGYVWRVDRNPRSINVLSNSEPLVKTYIFNIFNGDLIDTTEEEIPFI